MSENTVETILSRATPALHRTQCGASVSDPAFAEQLFADPDPALAGYDLTADEIAGLKEMSRAKSRSPMTEERKSFGYNNHDEIMFRCK